MLAPASFLPFLNELVPSALLSALAPFLVSFAVAPVTVPPNPARPIVPPVILARLTFFLPTLALRLPPPKPATILESVVLLLPFLRS